MSTAVRKKPYEAKKGETIAQASEWYSKASGVMFADYRGMTVKEMQKLRADLRKKGAEIHVLKNTLFRRAAGADVEKMPAPLHNGPTAVAFVFENEAECAKALLDFAATNKKIEIKGGFFGGKSLDASGVEALSKLPPREILIAQVIGAIAAPLTTLVGVVEALYADPIRVIGAVADKVAEGSPLPAPTESPSESDSSSAEAPAAEAPVPAESGAVEPANAEAAPVEAEAPAPAPETTPEEN